MSTIRFDYPCPCCRTSRQGIESSCVRCGWSPHARRLPPVEEVAEPEYGMITTGLIGLLACLPVIYMFCFASLLMFLMLFSVMQGLPNTSAFTSPSPGVEFLLTVHLATMVLTWGVTLFFILHSLQSPLVLAKARIFWVIVLILANAVILPVYWYRYFYKPHAELG